jgi:autotransporter-associated beta strand protein
LTTAQIVKGAGSATLNLNGGILRATVDQANFLSGFAATDVAIGNGGAVIDSDGHSIGIAMALSGTGSLTKHGVGTLTLTGSNTYRGETIVDGGTLIARGGAATPDASVVTVGLNGTYAVDGDETIGALAGNGNVVIGTGRTLTTSVNDQDATFAGAFSGAGSLEVIGAGTFTVTGASTFSGSTTVQAGRLAVNGSLMNSAVTVGSGATLSGTGTVGGVAAQRGAMIAPGNSIGTLNVAGNVSFGSGSTYETEINAAGQSDRIAASGTATLAGGTVRILADQGRYSTLPYTILTAQGGVTGRFAGTNSDQLFAFVTPTLRYSANAVTLTLLMAPGAFASVATTPNQVNVANAVEVLGDGNPLFSAVLGSTVAGARQAFNALSGEAHASATTTAYAGATLVQGNLMSRLRNPPDPSIAMGQGT